MNWLHDASDKRVQHALGRPCRLCPAQAGEWCRNPWDGKPLPGGRLVHRDRAERNVVAR